MNNYVFYWSFYAFVKIGRIYFFAAFPDLFFGRLCFARSICQNSLKCKSVCACVSLWYSPAQLLYAFAIFNVSCILQPPPLARRWARNLDSVLFGNILNIVYRTPRGSQRLPEAPRGSQRLGAPTHICVYPQTLCLPQHSVQWLHARKACTGGLAFPAEIPLTDRRRPLLAGRWARNLDSVLFGNILQYCVQRLPEAPKDPCGREMGP